MNDLGNNPPENKIKEWIIKCDSDYDSDNDDVDEVKIGFDPFCLLLINNLDVLMTTNEIALEEEKQREILKLFQDSKD